MNRKIAVLATLLLVASAPSVSALGKGTSMFAIQLRGGTADLADASGAGTGYITAYEHSELGVQGQLWHMMSDDYAMSIAGGLGFFNETDKPGPGAVAPAPDQKFSISSYFARLGGDRVVKVGQRAILYSGPGIEFWSGRAKFENFGLGPLAGLAGPDVYEGKRTKRISLNVRIGGVMMLTPGVGLTGHIGHSLGRASTEENGAKATWWPSGADGAGGLLFMFGAKD